jgi:hypothetical protein
VIGREERHEKIEGVGVVGRSTSVDTTKPGSEI